MDAGPLLAAESPIPFHAIAALAALGLGAVVIAAPKGTTVHRAMGWAWVILMAGVAGSSFFIRTGGDWSWIHLLSIVTLASLPLAVRAARRHRVADHRRAMLALFALALVLTGGFTLMPGRIMHAVVFGG